MVNQKIAFITGASSGIGYASAKLLLANGFKVYATARRTHLMKDLEESGAVVMACDVTRDEDVRHVVDTIIQVDGCIDVLFANAGFCLLGPVELQDIEDVRYQFDVNVLGNARTFTAVLPHMRKQRSGRIIITSSGAGHVGGPGFAWYPATKHAQQGVADGLRMEVKEFGIKVSLIEPGYINTDIDNASFPYLDKCENHPNAAPYEEQIKIFREKWGRGIDNGASPDTIAKAVLHAAQSSSPKRRYAPNMDTKLAKFMKRWFGYGAIDKIMPGQTIK
jgi:NAD(P)-dependent dehydrogenase (short-subunit alcohol dehydrogenase family)